MIRPSLKQTTSTESSLETPIISAVTSTLHLAKQLVPAASITTSNSAFRALAPAVPDQLVVCLGVADCSTNCYGYTLSQFAPGICYSVASSYSLSFVRQDSNAGLNYAVYAAVARCQGGIRISAVNTCYRITNQDGSIRSSSTVFRS